MDQFDRFDPALFGTWAQTPGYGDTIAIEDAALAGRVRKVLLETKSAEAARSASDELRQLLNEMTVEMRDQFSTFRRMRTSAEKALDGGDDAAQKLARADVKAATDAMSLIVRTLEKVDSLQRQLARDREDEADRTADQGGYEEARQRFMIMIQERANEIALRLYEAWKRDGPPAGVVETAEPAKLAATRGEDREAGGVSIDRPGQGDATSHNVA